VECSWDELRSKEKLTPHQHVDEITNPIAIRNTGIEHGLHFLAICESHGHSSGVQDEVMKEVAGELTWVGRK
jgi:hypothetical protein